MSESPEEQQSTGVLGRIGSWLSPWRVKSLTSSPETDSPTGEQTPKLELKEESGETGRSQGKEQQREEEQREPNSNPDPLGLPRVVLAREREDATQSAAAVSTAEAGARKEESVEGRKKRLRQDKEREESSSGASVSGIREKYAGHVTGLSSARNQSQALSERQAQTGRKLHVYLEETSVVQCSADRCAGQEVVRTKIPKSLKVTGAAKASLSSDSQEVSVTKRGQSKRTNARPAAGTDGALVGGSLKPHKDSQFETQKAQTEEDRMGRKNAARRKQRKSSAGDRGNSPHENKSQSGENDPERPTPGDSGTAPQGQTSKTEDSSASSSLQLHPSCHSSPEEGEGEASCPDTAKKHDNFQDTNSVSEGSALCVFDGPGNMEDEDSPYKVERKTETPESKRRSMKVSRSEVKLFTKNVRLSPFQSSEGDNQDIRQLIEKDEAKEKPKSEDITRQHDLKKIPVAGRIADKISTFEYPAGGVNKEAFQTPRRADASPVRKAQERLKANLDLSDQRSRLADSGLKARSSSASPCRDRLGTSKEGVVTFVAASGERKAAVLPPQSAVTGMLLEPTTCVTADEIKPPKLDIQGKLDGTDQMQANTKSKIALKQDGLDAVSPEGGITIPLEQPTASKVYESIGPQTEGQSAKKEAGVAAKGPEEPEEMTNNISLQSKGPSRTTLRSKRRKSKESALSPTPDGESTAVNQDQATFDFKLTQEGQGSPLDEQSHENMEVLEKQEEHSSARRREPEPPANKDEPDTAAGSAATKTGADKETGGGSIFVPQDGREASKDSREPPASSSSLPAVKQKQEAPVPSGSGQDPSEEKHEVEIMKLAKNDAGSAQKPHQDSGLINRSKRDESSTSDQANLTENPQSGAAGDGSRRAEESKTIRDGRQAKSDGVQLTALSSGHTEPTLPPRKDGQVETTCPRGAKAGGGANEGTIGGTKGERKLLKAEKHATKESTGTTTESAGKAAEKQSGPGLVEQMDHSPGDSCGHDAEFPAGKAAAEATAALGKVNHIALIPEGSPEGDLSAKEPARISASQSASKEGAGRTDEKTTSAVKCGASEGKISDEVAIVPPDELGKGGNGCALPRTPLKGVGKMETRPADSSLTETSIANKPPPVANGDISQQPRPVAAKAEAADDKPGQAPTLPASPEANKRSLKMNLNFSWGVSKEGPHSQQDAPSSWLDVDLPKQRLRVASPKLNPSGSESNLLDTSGEIDDDDFVEKIKKLCAPFSLPPRKHNPMGPPQPPFALPAIKEDRFEKTFDPEEFKFGLRKPKHTLDAATSTLNKLHNMESKSGQKPLRASLTDRSILLSSLDTQSRLRTPPNEDEDPPEEREEKVKVKSRLEGSCVLSSLASSLVKGRRNGAQPQAQAPNSGEVSPSNTPQPSPPPPSQPPATSAAAAQQSPAPSRGEEAPDLVNDSGPPLPSFTDIKLPDYFDKYLPPESRKPAQDVREQEPLQNEVIGKMSTQPPSAETEAPVQTSPGIPQAAPPSFPGKVPLTHPILTDPKDPVCKRKAKGFHKRPGKIVLFEKAQFSGQAYEIYRDMADATGLQLSAIISVKVVRGGWILYEKPDFQGRTIALEEGGIELSNMWGEGGAETEPQNGSPLLIGSVRLVVWDYSIPCIDLFTEPKGQGRVTTYRDDVIETGTYGIPMNTASIQVYSGVWLVFSDPGFQGMLAVLEKGEYPFPESWGFTSPFIGSLRPLKMGSFKVENCTEVKALVYEKPGFQGPCMDVDSNVFNFSETSVGSLKIVGGLWVGYSEPGFEGQQHILEEGEYWDSSDWGGPEGLKSLQPVLSDFFSPHLKMFRERDFGGVDIDITVPVGNMEQTGYGTKAQSLDVIGGVWVVFEELGFCGESYLLERGLYGSPEDWGALQPRVASAMPVVLSDFETTSKFKVQLFSEPGFQGSSLVLEESAPSLEDGFCVASCKVLSGSWLAFEGADFAGRLYVLEEGRYPDLKSMGCVQEGSVLSLQTVGFEFSLPSITLFERGGLRGKRVVLTDGTVNLPLTGSCSRVQSVLVEGGIWVVHEGINYRGAQVVLKPGEVPDWYKFSGWLKIGSLRPLPQKQVHFRLRNRQSGLMMSLAGDLDNIKMMRIQEMEETGELEQIWFYQNGNLHCKLLEEWCLTPSGSMAMAGSRISLTAEQDAQAHLWSVTPQGFICYTPTHNLVLDIKGGHHYDKNLVILNQLDPMRVQQLWDVEIL